MVTFESQWDLKDVKLSIPRDTRGRSPCDTTRTGDCSGRPYCWVQRTKGSRSPQTHCEARCMTENRMQAFTIGNEEGSRHSFTSQVTDQVQWAQMAKRVGMGSSNSCVQCRDGASQDTASAHQCQAGFVGNSNFLPPTRQGLGMRTWCLICYVLMPLLIAGMSMTVLA